MAKKPFDLHYDDPVDFDFEEWTKLAQEDPQAFEKRREEAINSLISTAPLHMHKRLHGLQFEIDAHCQVAKNPLDRCLKVYKMMWEKAVGEGGLVDAMNALNRKTHSNTLLKKPMSHNAKVINFTSKTKKTSAN
ncbi:MAG: hypothetical protein Tsb005_05850 [Gammaproteobacteria bacterium]